MYEYWKFFKDPAIIIAILMIAFMETSMQLGCYKPFIKRNSFASNVNRITDHALDRQKDWDPDVLILGTSMAYEGLSPEILNIRLKAHGLKIQSIAIPGAELVVQALALEKVLREFQNVKYIIHVNEAEMPWVDFETLSPGTRAMVSEFDRRKVYFLLNDFDYKVSFSDWLSIMVRLINYRKDIGDWILNPLQRLKYFGRERKEKANYGISSYENRYEKSLALYSFSNLEECIGVTGAFSPIVEGSNAMHRDSIFSTCLVAKEKKLESGTTESTIRYKKRLSQLYQLIGEKDIHVVHVFPPLPYYLDFVNYPERIAYWKENYSDLLSEDIVDFHDLFSREEGTKYFYDLVHLNRKGNEEFSYRLADELDKIFQKREPQNAL